MKLGEHGTRALTLSVALAALAGGCTTTTPARPLAPEAVAQTSTERRPTFNGPYTATFSTRWVGPIRTRFTFEPTGEGFKANTRPGVAWTIVGGLEGVLGPLLAPFLFPGGMILTWTSSLPEGPEVGRGSLGFATVPTFRTPTTLYSPGGAFVVTAMGRRPLALISLEPGAAPTPDYSALAERVAAELPVRYFDPSIGAGSAAAKFAADLRNGAAQAQDDGEWMFVALVAARSRFRTGWPLIYPRADDAHFARVAGDWAPSIKSWSIKRDFSDGIVTLDVDAFTDAPSVDAAFAAAASWEHRGLILDLRNASGIDPAAALFAASRLIDKPAELGVLVGPSARGAMLASPQTQAPATVEFASTASMAAIESELDRTGAVRVVVLPSAERMTTPLAVLTSQRTSGVSEWVVRLVKSAGTGVVVGEPTAGRPLASRAFDIGQGWVLRVGAADLFVNGRSATGENFRPDTRTGRDDAPDTAKSLLLKGLPRAGGPGREPAGG
jgi:hypothetical protein